MGWAMGVTYFKAILAIMATAIAILEVRMKRIQQRPPQED